MVAREREEEEGEGGESQRRRNLSNRIHSRWRWEVAYCCSSFENKESQGSNIFILLFFSSELSFSLDEREKDRDRRDYFLRDFFMSAMVFLLSFTRTSRNTSSINEIKKVFVQQRCDTIDTWRPRFHEEEIFFFLDGI